MISHDQTPSENSIARVILATLNVRWNAAIEREALRCAANPEETESEDPDVIIRRMFSAMEDEHSAAMNANPAEAEAYKSAWNTFVMTVMASLFLRVMGRDKMPLFPGVPLITKKD